MTKIQKILLGISLALALVTSAGAQLIYGNTFPFWNVNGPLTVVGATSLTGVTTQTGAMGITGALTQSGGNVSLSGTTVGVTGATTITGATAVTGAVSATTTVTGTTAVITGGFYRTAVPNTQTADYIVLVTDSYIIANKAGALSLTLPDPTAAANAGRILCFKTSQAQTVVSATSNVVPLITAAAGTAILAGTAGKWACGIADGTNWVLMEGN